MTETSSHDRCGGVRHGKYFSFDVFLGGFSGDDKLYSGFGIGDVLPGRHDVVVLHGSQIYYESESVVVEFGFGHVRIVDVENSFRFSVQVVCGNTVAVDGVGSSVYGDVHFGDVGKNVLFAVYRVRVLEQDDDGSHAYSGDVDGFYHGRLIFSPVGRFEITDVFERKVRVGVLRGGFRISVFRLDGFVNKLGFFQGIICHAVLAVLS